MNKNNLRLLLVFALMLSAPFLTADMGPKPSAEFEIIYQIEPIPELTGYSLYECETPDCDSPYLLEELGPQHFDCSQESCSSMAYGYAEYLYIVLEFSDGTVRQSNIFDKNHFNAEYTINVLPDSLLVVEIGGSSSGIGLFAGVIYGTIGLTVCGGLLLLVVIVLLVRNARKKKTAGQAGEV